MTFFLDNTNPPRFARILRELEEDAHHLSEKFSPSTPDLEWMPQVASLGWTAITADRRIIVRPQEKELRQKVKLTTIFLPKGHSQLRVLDQLQFLLKAWVAIKNNTERARPGDCFEVRQNGKVDLLAF